MKQYKNISNRRDNAIHMAQLKTEHLSGIMHVKERLKVIGEGLQKDEKYEQIAKVLLNL